MNSKEILHYKSIDMEYWYYLDENKIAKYHNPNGPAYISTIRKEIYITWDLYGKEIGRADSGYTQEKFEQYKKLLVFI